MVSINKNKMIEIPQYLLSGIVTVVTAAFIAWGTVSIIETKVCRNEEDIERLRVEKVSRDEFNIILNRFDEIERKIDEINKSK